MTNANPTAPVTPARRRPLSDKYSPGAVYRQKIDTYDLDTNESLPLLTKPESVGVVLAHRRAWIIVARRRHRRAVTDRIIARGYTLGAPEWPGLADGETIETAIGRWEGGA